MVEIIFGGKRISPLPKTPKVESQEKERKKSKRYKNKKHNIKFPLTKEDEKTLKYKALEHNLSVTVFSNIIIKNELSKSHKYENYEYDVKGKLMNVCLDEEEFGQIKRLSIEWNISLRRVVHRIIKGYIVRMATIKMTSHTGVQINYYRKENENEIQ